MHIKAIAFAMKLLVVLAAFVAACASSDIVPVVPGDNSHYIEGVSRYIWMFDDDGKPILEDLQAPVDNDEDMSRNGANNQYWLFTRRNRDNRQILTNGNINSVRNSNYNGNLQIKVIVHGYTSNGNSNVNTLIRRAFLDRLDCNVIVVDWANAARTPYNSAANRVPDVGRHIGRFLNWLISNAGGNWNNVHLVGFSLGAHAVGNAGREVGGRPRRVTGLDPAGPLWGGNSNALNRNAGRYVEAIHTDGRALGIMDRSADADFYPNGGRHRQPGCGLVDNSCSHSRSYHLFAHTIRSDNLVGRLCTNLSQAQNNQCTGNRLNMGNHNLGKSGSGIFGLRTNDRAPFQTL